MAFQTKSHTSCLLEEWGSSAAPEQQEAKWQAERRNYFKRDRQHTSQKITGLHSCRGMNCQLILHSVKNFVSLETDSAGN